MVVAAIAAVLLFVIGYVDLTHQERQTYPALSYQPARTAATRLPSAHPSLGVRGYQPFCVNPVDPVNADLCAQWAGVQATEEGNRLGRLNITITGLEFGALIFSLSFTGWAAFAAARSAAAAERAVEAADRPHIMVPEFEARRINVMHPDTIPLRVRFENFGSGPGWIERYRMAAVLAPQPPQGIGFDGGWIQGVLPIAPKKWVEMGGTGGLSVPISPDQIGPYEAGELKMFVAIHIDYRGSSGSLHQHRLLFRCHPEHPYPQAIPDEDWLYT